MLLPKIRNRSLTMVAAVFAASGVGVWAHEYGDGSNNGAETRTVASTENTEPDCSEYALDDAISDGKINPTRLPFQILAHYRQTEYQLHDPLGDYALAQAVNLLPKRMRQALFRRKEKLDSFDQSVAAAGSCATRFFGLNPVIPPEPLQFLDQSLFEKQEHLDLIETLPVSEIDREALLAAYHDGRLDLEGRNNPVPVEKLSELFLQVISEEHALGLPASFGTVHQWDPAFRKNNWFVAFPLSRFSKLLLALSRGESGKYMRVGTEEQLLEWLMSRELRSVTLDQMFRASYRLNKGDVYLALLTVENVLALNWRNKKRQALPFILRLKPFINHFGISGDTYGTWYHLFGIMLYGYASGPVAGVFAGKFENFGSQLLSSFAPEKQEQYINSRGPRIGARLARAVRNQEYVTPRFNSTAPKADSASLGLPEDFSRRVLKWLKKHKKGEQGLADQDTRQ